MENTFIYIILDPFTNQVRYVGKTSYPKARFYSHLHTKKNTHCSKWINSILEKGDKPEFIILEEVLNKDWQFWESYWIEQFKSWGFNLTNLTSGGEGCNKRIVSKETRLKISESQKGDKSYWYGKTFSKEHVDKIIRKGDNHHFKNKKLSQEHKDKIRDSKKGSKLSQSHKNKISNSLKGSNNPNSRKVINLETGIIYVSIREAAKAMNIKITTLFSYLSGKTKNKTKLKYYD